jgi:hypothetical protein
LSSLHTSQFGNRFALDKNDDFLTSGCGCGCDKLFQVFLRVFDGDGFHGGEPSVQCGDEWQNHPPSRAIGG